MSEVISSTPNFKACGPDGISMEFFKALIPAKDDSEESSENNRKWIDLLFKYNLILIL